MSQQTAKLEFQSSGMERAMAMIAVLREAGLKAAADALNEVGLMWQSAVIRHMPVDKGLARNSVGMIPAIARDEHTLECQVGTNVPYVVALEYGIPGARGLFGALQHWSYGMEPIKNWYAKDLTRLDLMNDVHDLEGTEDHARALKKLAKFEAGSTEEFAPPFRGSWQLIERRVVDRLRAKVADAIQQGLISKGQSS